MKNSKESKAGFTAIEMGIVIFILMIITVMGGCTTVLCIGGCRATKYVQENGVKGVSEAVWNGNGKKESE